jgi:nickel transport protein
MIKKISLFLSLLIITGQLWAHGLEIEITRKAPVVILKAIYDDHEAIGNAKTIIHPPDYADIVYQSGITDINGIFVFIPDAPGDWLVEVDDESGHKVKETVTVDSAFFSNESPQQALSASANLDQEEHSSAPCKIPVWIKLLLGLLVIFSLTTIFYYKKQLASR